LGSTGSFPDFSLVHNGYLYFTALEASTGFEIWKTDGTLLGTTMVADINPGSASSVINNRMVEYNGELYFVADDGTHGFELFKFGFPVIDPMFSDGFEDIGPI
jgi:ELWxxDGT repeat protein